MPSSLHFVITINLLTKLLTILKWSGIIKQNYVITDKLNCYARKQPN